MYPLRAALLALAVFSLTVNPASAQSLPNVSSPYSLSLSGSWALRSDASPGLKWAGAESRQDYGSIPDYNRASLYADWFPFVSSGFRVVGGLSYQDNPATLLGSAQASYGGASYQLRSRSPSTSTYLGIGYGQHDLGNKGLGFYADMGVSLGPLASESDSGQGSMATGVGLDGWRSQNNGLLGFRYLPSVSLGLIYRY
jgi:hypothetical protein